MRDSIWFTAAKPPKSPTNSDSEDSEDEDAGDMLTPVELDVQKFEDLFCVAPPVPGQRAKKREEAQEAAASETKSPQAISLLDSRRAQNVSIGAAMFKRMRGLGPAEVRAALAAFDDSALSAEDCVALEPLLPTSEERSLIQGYLTQTTDPEGLKLAFPEQFLHEMIRDPNVPHYVSAFIFRASLNSEPKQIEEDMALIGDVCSRLRKSDTLRKVVIAARDIGNLTNYEYSGRTTNQFGMPTKKAVAVKIDSLSRLRDVRSADGKMTLMNYLVEMVSRSDPKVAELPGEFSDLKKARMVSVRDLVAQASALRRSFSRLSGYRYRPAPDDAHVVFEERFAVFAETAKERLEVLESKIVAARGAWETTAGYFLEDLEEYEPVWDQVGGAAGGGVSTPATTLPGNEDGKKQPEQLFSSLDLFINYLNEAVQQNRKRVEDEAKKVRRAKEAEEKAARAAKAGKTGTSGGKENADTPSRRRGRRPSLSIATDRPAMSFSDVVMQAALKARMNPKLGLDPIEDAGSPRTKVRRGEKGLACAGCGKIGTSCECKF